MQKKIEVAIGNEVLAIETHKWAKLSNGSANLTYKDNVMLVTANMNEKVDEGKDFLPLMVDFREYNYAAGKIPGGYIKREGKPSDKEVLLSRLIDRPIRPLFPEFFYNETQIIAMLMSADFSIDYEAMGIIGASAALLSSTIPFSTPVAAVKVGWKEGEFYANPSLEMLESMDLIVRVAGTQDDILMLEAEGNEFSENVFKQSLIFAKEIISDICEAQKALINPNKVVITEDEERKDILSRLESLHKEELKEAIFTKSKKERNQKIEVLKNKIFADVEDEKLAKYKSCFHSLESKVFRQTLLETKKRNDGRDLDEVRDLSTELSVLPRVHGSAIFTRGETTALATVTLGAEDDAQRIDNLNGSNELKKFMLHYNFPPFSVGEVSFLRGTGRREIGHGNLAEKALARVMPSSEEFPYTVRVVSDVLESNGSSSQATICGGSLALMNAGVPIKAPVAGIAMGLVKEDDNYVVLTDIAGFEDHFGDMDFKIAGTSKGITAIQLDIKIDGLSDEIIDKTLANSKKAREHILTTMNEAISKPQEKVSQYAPVMLSLQIKPDKVRDLIGPGGKVIKDLINTYNVKINVEDDGSINVAAPDMEVAQKVEERINLITAVPEIDKVYKGKVNRVEDYGLFVEIIPGVTGLLHISEIAQERLKTIKDANINLGDEIDVKVIDIDRDKRIKLSRKVLL